MQLNLIPKLENYPGTLMSSGPLLAKTLENQYLSFNGEITYDSVERIDETESGLHVKTLRSEYNSKAIVLASGKVPNNLGVEKENVFANKGVHYCTRMRRSFLSRQNNCCCRSWRLSFGIWHFVVENGI